ncbi:aromatic acid exporter family protein [Streptomyces sp. NPDC017993]|uniref:aromatic acid exporter family protein n=1 Tax=Streptomyces sp. NPDC017993 TaxID=3365027 RepID=UPI0037B38977
MAGGVSAAEPVETGRLARIGQWWSRAWGSDGHERHTALLIGKSALAATIAWVISYNLLNAQSPAFAPFSAVLIMQVTVYQSLVQSLRYVGAVAAGVAVQAALGFLAGPEVVTFALVTLAALVIGRWPALGAQRGQVATAAFFAFSTYTSATGNLEKLAQLGQIVLLVIIGSAVALAVNLAVFPPMRFRSAEYSIRTLAHALGDLLSDIHPALAAGEIEEERTEQWRTRAAQTGELITQARAGMHTAQESLYYNPRRLLRRHRERTSFENYGAVLDALERTLYQAASLTRSLDQWRDSETTYPYRPFLESYATFLEAIADIAQLLSTLDEDHLASQAADLCQLAERAQHCRSQMAAQAEGDGLPLADPTRPYGVLTVEATRLMEEFQHTSDVLRRYTTP